MSPLARFAIVPGPAIDAHELAKLEARLADTDAGQGICGGVTKVV